MGAIRTVKVNNAQKYLLTDTISTDNQHSIQILARPTASSTLTEGAIVGKEYRFYLDFSQDAMLPVDSADSVTVSATLSVQPIRNYTCEVQIWATLYGGGDNERWGELIVQVDGQTILSTTAAYSIVNDITIYGAGLSLYFYIGKDHKLRALAQRTAIEAGMYNDMHAKAGSYTTAQLEAGAGTELDVSAPTAVSRSPWGGDFGLNYCRQSYYDGDTVGGITRWETPWDWNIVEQATMSINGQGSSIWRVPYSTYCT